MNPQLHHKWNNARDDSRGSTKEAKTTPEEKVTENKIILKQDRPR